MQLTKLGAGQASTLLSRYLPLRWRARKRFETEELGNLSLAVKKKDASLCCNRHAGLVGDDKAPTALEVLFREEHLDVPGELLVVLGRQARDVGNILLNDRVPFGRKWSATNRDSSPTPKPRKHGRWCGPSAIPVARS